MTHDLSDDERRQLMDAGSGALTFNAPLSQTRAEGIIESIASWNPKHIVDFGCGSGAFASAIAAAVGTTSVLGLDTIAAFVETAHTESAATFEVADASTWLGPCNVAISIGSSHAFDGPGLMLDRFTEIGATYVVIGDGFWAAEPDEWCVETFGEMPDGLAAVRAEALEHGWDPIELAESTIEEWDAFEGGWRQGVRDVGTLAANDFADDREAEYARYRGVLGFSWLCARRTV